MAHLSPLVLLERKDFFDCIPHHTTEVARPSLTTRLLLLCGRDCCHLIVQPHAVLLWRQGEGRFLSLCYYRLFFSFVLMRCWNLSLGRMNFWISSLSHGYLPRWAHSRFLSNHNQRNWGRFAALLVLPCTEGRVVRETHPGCVSVTHSSHHSFLFVCGCLILEKGDEEKRLMLLWCWHQHYNVMFLYHIHCEIITIIKLVNIHHLI